MGNICQKFVPQPKRNYRSTPFKSISSNLSASMNKLDQHLSLKQMNNDECEILSLTSQNTQSYLSSGNLKETEQQKQLKISIQNFQPIKRLGRGSFGQVLLVKNKQTSKNYALKVIEKSSIINYQQKLNTLSQRYLLQALDFPFIVKLHYAFQSKTRLYLLVDFMGGGQLFYLLRKKKHFTEQQAKFYAAQILLALQYLHSRNIIYRDLKPQNILLTNQGHVKIADFGLSKICFNKNQLAYSICGTPQYIAPQIITGKGYTQSADWFSFGSLIYDMLTGRPPFFSKNKHRILYNITTKQIPIPQTLSPEAQSLLKALFAINPQERLGSNQGAKEIKAHDFFNGIDFEQLKNLNVKPPLKFDQTLVNKEGFDEQITQKSIQFHFSEEKLVQDPLFEHYEYMKSSGTLLQKKF